MKKLINNISLLLLLSLTFLMTACNSPEDELVGSWSTSFGLDNEYTKNRSIHEMGKTMIERITFTKGSNGKGTFVDVIFPVLPGKDDMAIGSKVTGEWEIKDKKLYLYYDGLTLTGNTDIFTQDNQETLRHTMSEKFYLEYHRAGKEGFTYSITEKSGKKCLEIHFKNDVMTFTKDSDKE